MPAMARRPIVVLQLGDEPDRRGRRRRKQRDRHGRRDCRAAFHRLASRRSDAHSAGQRRRGERLLRQEPDGALVPHINLDDVAAGFNEITVDGRGNTYVNGAVAEFDFMAFINRATRDMQAGDTTPLHQRSDYVPGRIVLITPDGTVRQVADDIAFPNGMVVTPDNRTLIISESFTGTLTAFDIADGGGLSNRRVFADGLGPDGICMDADGAIWTSEGEQDCVRVAEGGEILNRVELDRGPFACMLGGPDGRTLFIMAAEWNPENAFDARTGQVLTVDAPAPHIGWP